MSGGQLSQFPLKKAAKITGGALLAALAYVCLTLIITRVKEGRANPLTPDVPRWLAIALPFFAALFGATVATGISFKKCTTQKNNRDRSATQAAGNAYADLPTFSMPTEPLIPLGTSGDQQPTISSPVDTDNDLSFKAFRANVQANHPEKPSPPAFGVRVIAGGAFLPFASRNSAPPASLETAPPTEI